MKLKIKEVANKIKDSKHCVIFTGAGISVESGIPPFRGKGGTWNKFDPVILELEYFKKKPSEAWKMIKERFLSSEISKPNKAHEIIGKMCKSGYVKSVITQNVDNLHQEGGSDCVVEIHGNAKTLVCLSCGDERYISNNELLGDIFNCHSCGGILKPNFTFFGEQLPVKEFIKANDNINKADVLIIIGTSGEVHPAASLPEIAVKNNCYIVNINPEYTPYDKISNTVFRRKASDILSLIEEELFQ